MEEFIEPDKFSINDKAIIKNKLMIFTLLFIGLMIIFSYSMSSVSAASGDNIYVNTHGNDSWNGQNPIWNGTSGPKLSIKNATETVNTNGTVNIANGMYTGMGNTQITLDKNVNIIGQSKDGTVINGNGKNWIFHIKTGIIVNISNLTINNCKSNNGGAIYNKGTLMVNNCTFKDNNAYGGGAIDSYIGSTLTVVGCSFNQNKAYFGGAIENAGKMNVDKGIFTDNSATYGGAIDNADNISINNSNLTDNHAIIAGGAVSNYQGYIYLHYNKIVGNTAGTGSAIIYGVGSADLTQNWWGSNSGPLNSVIGTSNFYPWLISNSTTKKPSITPNNTVTSYAYAAKTKQTVHTSYLSISSKSTETNLTYSTGVQYKTIRITFNQPIKAGSMWIEIKNSMGNIKILGITIQGNILIIKVSALLSGKYTIILHNASINSFKGTPIPYSVCNFSINSTPTLELEQIPQQNVMIQSKSSNPFDIKTIILQTVKFISGELIRI
ncbi:hypothetical protein [Methanobacterium sp.]|uniref:hypothetical protein n=1 Tax=Methanobacterium sp. TaxID=2164 RepID=UPI003C7204BC